MTNNEHSRIVSAFVRKHDPELRWGYSNLADYTRGVIQAVVADTALILEGHLTVEDFE